MVRSGHAMSIRDFATGFDPDADWSLAKPKRSAEQVGGQSEADRGGADGGAREAGRSAHRFTLDGEGRIVPPGGLVKGLLPSQGIAFIGGQSGSGKTFVAINLAVALATGGDFFGRRVREQVGTAIIAAEGAGTLPGRIEAARRFAGERGPLPIGYRAFDGDLKSRRDRGALVFELRSLGRDFQARFGVRLGLIVIDTVAAAFALVDENANAEAAGAIRALAQISAETGALVAPVHHFGKTADTGLRGASAWRAGADTVISVLADRDETSGVVRSREAALAKSRDGVEGPIAPFELRHVPLGTDEDGEAFGSLAVAPLLDAPTRMASRLRTRAVPKATAALIEAVDEAIIAGGCPFQMSPEGPSVIAAPVRAVRDVFLARWATGEDDAAKRADAGRKAFTRALARLPTEFATTSRDGVEWIWRARP